MKEIEFAILAAIDKLSPNAYGATILGELGEHVSLGRIYIVIDSLETNGMIYCDEAPGGAERGYSSKRMCRLTRTGQAEIALVRRQIVR